MQASIRTSTAGSFVSRSARSTPRVAPRAIPPQLIAQIAERTGTVDAGLEVPIIAGIVVALAGTLLVPLALKPGQEASDKIFKGENRGKTSVKTNVKGGRTTLRK